MSDDFENPRFEMAADANDAAWLRAFLATLERCESPIERQLLTALMSVRPSPYTTMDTQVSIEIEGRSVRVDIVIADGPVRLAIECDGHDFHERTKEQAARDRSRDRLMVADGWTVLRFTGSEIHRDPYGCAREAWEQFMLAGVRSAGSEPG